MVKERGRHHAWDCTYQLSDSIFGKYTFLFICSLTFSHRPNEVTSVWRPQKLVCSKL